MSWHLPALLTTSESWRVLGSAHVPSEGCLKDVLGNWMAWSLLSVPLTSRREVLINSKVLFLYSEPGLIFLQQY